MNSRPRVRLSVALVLMTGVATLGPSAIASPPARVSTQEVAAVAQAPPVVAGAPPAVRPGEVIVKAAAGGRGALRAALAQAGASGSRALGRGVSVVTVPPGREQEAAARLSRDPAVAYAEPNYVRFASSHVDAEMGWGVRRVRASAVWRRSPAVTGGGVRVAVLDSGVDHTQPELTGRVADGYDAYGRGGRDDCGHGTAVAGVVAASHDGLDVVGVAPTATIVPVKVLAFDRFFGLCGGDDAAIIEGLRWAADPARGAADVINLSFGGPQTSRALRDAIVYAARQGVLVVAAAGNTGDRTVSYPAAYPQVISVGGVRRAGSAMRWWPASSFGAVDVVAAAQNVPVLRARGVDATLIGRACPGDASRWCANGTSFAAPHVAGVAALLHDQHPRLADVPAGARLRRLRQWILGTAPRVIGTSPGMDLRAGHGRVDAAAAAAASTDAAAMLLTWQTAGRILAPTRLMAATPWRLRMQLVLTRGTGQGIAGRAVRFTPSEGGTASRRTATTTSSGRAEVLFSSTRGGRLARLTATVAGRSLAADGYVLHRDDNVPGVALPASPFRRRLRVIDDVDDVFRVPLVAGETLRARVTAVDQPREQVVLYLHRPATADVTNPYRPPLREDGAFDGLPQRLKVTVTRDGVYYLDAFGYGTYRLAWAINVPGRVTAVTASPTTITTNGDGRDESTRVSWRLHRAGSVALVVRNGAGDMVRRMSLGQLPRGAHAHRWGGRNQSGRYVPSGRYAVRIVWSDGRGRRSADAATVTVRR